MPRDQEKTLVVQSAARVTALESGDFYTAAMMDWGKKAIRRGSIPEELSLPLSQKLPVQPPSFSPPSVVQKERKGECAASLHVHCSD